MQDAILNIIMDGEVFQSVTLPLESLDALKEKVSEYAEIFTGCIIEGRMSGTSHYERAQCMQ